MSRKAARWGTLPIVFVEFAGFCLAFYLFLISARVLYPENIPCPVGAIFSCTTALRGSFSKFGPFSIAALGMVYFVFHLALTALLKPKGRLTVVKLITVLSGVAFVAYLRSIEILWLRKICPWCYGVAAVVLVQAYLATGLAVPPLPKMRPLRRVAATAAVFVLFVVGGVGVAYLSGGIEQALLHRLFNNDSEAEIEYPEPTPTPEIVRATPTPTPTPPPSDTTGLPQPRVTPSTTPAPVAQSRAEKLAALKLPDADLDTEEARVLRRLGWKIVPDEQFAYQAVEAAPPVLLLVFDPYCDECAHLIRHQLPDPSLAGLPVTRIAIESGNLYGKMSAMVSQVPTLVLVDQAGKIMYNHVGRIEPGDLKAGLDKALAGQ